MLGQAGRELPEDPLHVLHVQVVAVVIELHVRHHHHLGPQQQQRAVRLVGLTDHELALAVTGVGTHVVQLSAHQEGGILAGVHQTLG